MDLKTLEANTLSVRPNAHKRAVEPSRVSIQSIKFKNKDTFHGSLGIKAYVLSEADGDPYTVVVAFDNLQRTLSEITPTDEISCERPTPDHNIRVRCDCQDYRFTWAPYNEEHGSFVGKPFPEYEVKGTGKPRNPTHTPGMCKHIMGVIEYLKGYSLIGEEPSEQEPTLAGAPDLARQNYVEIEGRAAVKLPQGKKAEREGIDPTELKQTKTWLKNHGWKYDRKHRAYM